VVWAVYLLTGASPSPRHPGSRPGRAGQLGRPTISGGLYNGPSVGVRSIPVNLNQRQHGHVFYISVMKLPATS